MPQHDQDMALIREMGATIIRLSHYEHAEHFHDLADRDRHRAVGGDPAGQRINNSTAFTANARQQLVELIRQNYNHPSIFFWGIGNEQRTDDTHHQHAAHRR